MPRNKLLLLICLIALFITGCTTKFSIYDEELQLTNILLTDGRVLTDTLLVVFSAEKKFESEPFSSLALEYELLDQNEKVLFTGSTLVSFLREDKNHIINELPNGPYKLAAMLIEQGEIRLLNPDTADSMPIAIQEIPFAYLAFSASAPTMVLPNTLASNRITLTKTEIISALNSETVMDYQYFP